MAVLFCDQFKTIICLNDFLFDFMSPCNVKNKIAAIIGDIPFFLIRHLNR